MPGGVLGVTGKTGYAVAPFFTESHISQFAARSPFITNNPPIFYLFDKHNIIQESRSKVAENLAAKHESENLKIRYCEMYLFCSLMRSYGMEARACATATETEPL
jgi:hypothetical protein